MVSDKGGKYGFVYKSRHKAYRGMPKSWSKSKRARIANAGRTKAGRKRMARKAVATKRRRYGKSMRRKK